MRLASLNIGLSDSNILLRQYEVEDNEILTMVKKIISKHFYGF